jgi:hypothetical protein
VTAASSQYDPRVSDSHVYGAGRSHRDTSRRARARRIWYVTTGFLIQSAIELAIFLLFLAWALPPSR